MNDVSRTGHYKLILHSERERERERERGEAEWRWKHTVLTGSVEKWASAMSLARCLTVSDLEESSFSGPNTRSFS